MNRIRRQTAPGAVAVAVLLLAAAPAEAQAPESQSAPLASELARLLESAQLDAIAARSPKDPDRFVAALYFANSLLVVSAQYVAPSLLVDKIAQGEYRDVYIELNSAYVPDSKIFVQDQRADGLSPTRRADEPYDRFANGAQQLAFDGDWRKRRVTEADYMKEFRAADERYAEMLTVLLAELRKPTS
jgi:hypothetical protein